MSDCPNIEMREALPELVHGRLSALRAVQVREHLAACADCAAELELLERARRVYASVRPAVDTAAIVRALPRPARSQPDVTARPRRTYSLGMLQLAAAVLVLLAGGLVLRSVMKGAGKTGGAAPTVVAQPPADSALDTAPPLPRVVLPAPRSGEPRVLAMSLSDLDGLEVDDLETMLAALDRIDAAPAAEPDTLIGSVPGIGSSEG